TQRLQERDAVLQHQVRRGMLAAGRHGTHERPLRTQRGHADAVAQQRATGAAAGRVDGDHGNAHLGEVRQEAVEQLVGDGRFAGATGAGDADDRRNTGSGAGSRESGAGRPGCPLFAQLDQLGFGEGAIFDRAEHLADGNLVLDRRDPCLFRLPATGYRFPRVRSTPHHILDHRHQPHVHAVVGVVDALDAVGLELADLLGGDGAAAAGEDLDVAGVALAQHIDHVLEVLDVAALVAGQGDAVGILLQRGADHVLDAAVVAQVHDLGALRLDQPAHDVDRGVVAVEQAGGGDEAQRGRGLGLRGGGGGVLGRDGIHSPIVAPWATAPGLLLFGEVHDNAAGHALRWQHLSGYVDGKASVAIAMEQFDRERQAELDAAMARCQDAACVIDAAAPDKSGWTWDYYAPV